MNFLANKETENHLTTLTDKLKLYNETFFAVAFLKVSGLNKIIQPMIDFLKLGGNITIVAGQNFGLTEPIALHTIRKLFQDFPSSKLYLAKANSTNSVFHPKLYLFINKGNCCVISGSANVTEGGLIKNKETSIIAECNETEAIWEDAKSYFDSLLTPENAEEATLLAIKKYETFFEQQKQHNKKAKLIPARSKSQLAFDYESLLKYFQEFDNTELKRNYKIRLSNYKIAKKVLDEIADDTRLTKKKFEPLLDSLVGSKGNKSLWHSGSLKRLRRHVYPHYKEFRDLVNYIRINKQNSPSVVFSNAKVKVESIEGASVNYITEIMMTYNFKDFANLNKNPITALRVSGGVNIKSSSISYTGQDYEEYCELIKEISEKLGLQNMLEADSFFNDIYWKIKIK